VNGKIRVMLGLAGICALFTFPFLALFVFREYPNVADGALGYVNAFGIAVITNATILIPIPSTLPIVAKIADHNNLVGVAAVYAMGSAIGELTSYFLGRLANKIPGVETSRIHGLIERLMKGRKRTSFVLFVMAVTPSPYDFGGALAGNARYPWPWFVGVTFAGRWIKYIYSILLWNRVEVALSGVSWLAEIAPILIVALLFLVPLLIARQKKLRRRFKAG